MVYTGRFQKQHSTIDKHVLYSTTVSYRKCDITENRNFFMYMCILD